ncbi:hypothetical protein T07_14752 [Trichinella nelsoni]|uniref:Uncharacterized protein n=1 Tax=Trichinella nelsoni TaxID=6336 RepID=A0A0V0RZG6_9BILA|nr:hypothetical protein T07_14752 [Trichinella nelsoni]
MPNSSVGNHYDENRHDLEPIPFLFVDSETLRKYQKNDAYPNFQAKCSISDWDIEFLASEPRMLIALQII